jgi:hypothetical protein
VRAGAVVLRDDSGGAARVITIESVMLVVLGVLLASFVVILVAPAYWARAVRFTTARIRESLPVTEEEVRADKDRIRAGYAIRVHRLETQVEQSRLSAARQRVELNRRDAAITALESDVGRLTADLEENQNARRVLEQTVTDRVPIIEQRLAETRKLLLQRDREIAALDTEASKTIRALDEAMQINAQQRAEIDRLTTTLATRGARNRDSLNDPVFEGELALRSELEALRARAREQANLIDRLQSQRAEGALAGAAGPDPMIELARRELAAAEAALKSIREGADKAVSKPSIYEEQVRSLKAKTEDQAATIKRLEASLAAYEQEPVERRSMSLKDSKIAMKARLGALQAQTDSQGELIQKLRAELAAANERLARQATHYMEEMRRLGVGTLPASGHPRRAITGAARGLAERLGQSRLSPSPERAAAAPVVLVANDTAAPKPETNGAGHAEAELATSDVAPAPAPGAANAPQPDAAPAPNRPRRLLDRISGIGKS